MTTSNAPREKNGAALHDENDRNEPMFKDTLADEIAESMKDPEYAAAWRSIEDREAVAAEFDRRVARRVREMRPSRAVACVLFAIAVAVPLVLIRVFG